MRLSCALHLATLLFREARDRRRRRPSRSGMTDWWTALESEILNCLEHVGTVTPAEIGRRLGIPEAAATSLLSVMVRDGKVRIRLVELARGDSDALETNAAPPRRGLA